MLSRVRRWVTFLDDDDWAVLRPGERVLVWVAFAIDLGATIAALVWLDKSEHVTGAGIGKLVGLVTILPYVAFCGWVLVRARRRAAAGNEPD